MRASRRNPPGLAWRAGWSVFPVLLLALVACQRPPDEEIIRTRLTDMTEALADGSVRSFMAPVAADFSAETRDLDDRALRLLVRRELVARERVRVLLIDTRVEFYGDDRAVASFNALATGGSGLIPQEGRLWRVETGWRRAGSDWELITASWEPVAGR